MFDVRTAHNLTRKHKTQNTKYEIIYKHKLVGDFNIRYYLEIQFGNIIWLSCHLHNTVIIYGFAQGPTLSILQSINPIVSY
jgi:hypothetical protein